MKIQCKRTANGAVVDIVYHEPAVAVQTAEQSCSKKRWSSFASGSGLVLLKSISNSAKHYCRWITLKDAAEVDSQLAYNPNTGKCDCEKYNG